ncbi:MAG: antitoxin Xre/MbcA/ParS toxin-binding domain-containing protein [Steroidobacteraceae bacterium]|jgi:putative toxin-antitoxin system antitoxin component (TIGR02293 family)
MSSNLKLRLPPARATSLKQVLALKNPPAGGLGWHGLIESGLPSDSLYTVAKAIGVADKYLANFLEVDLEGLKDKGTLGRVASDLLFAVARAYTRAATRLGTEQAGLWLVTPQPALGDRAPIDALRTRVGTEYVSGLINQMGQRQTLPQEERKARAASVPALTNAGNVALGPSAAGGV